MKELSRRRFVEAGGLAAAGLAIGAGWPREATGMVAGAGPRSAEAGGTPWRADSTAPAPLGTPATAEGASPDLLLLGGTVYTVDEARPRAQAFAVKNGRFLAVGSDDDIRHLPAPTPRCSTPGGSWSHPASSMRTPTPTTPGCGT